MKKGIALIALVLTFACRAKEEVAGIASGGSSSAAPNAAQKAVYDSGGARGQTVRAGGEAPAPMPRMIVRSADMRITVADTARAVDSLTKSAEAQGGYVAGSHVWREGELLRARLTLRVPADRLTATLAQIRALAKRVDNETISSEDVSQEFVDLGARVRNLESTEEELRQLLVIARQNSRKAADVLEVHQQLTVIRGDIEQAKGRMRYLSQITAMSSISLELTPDALAQPVVKPGWQPLVVAKNAVRALVGVMQALANAAIWLVIYVAPLVGILFVIVFGTWKLTRRVRVT